MCRTLRCVLLVLLLAGPACYRHLSVGTSPAPGADVRVVLVSSMEIVTVGTAGARTTHVGVLEASGRVSAAAGDTLALRLGELRGVTRVIVADQGETALLPVSAIARVEQRRFSAGNTVVAGLGVVTLLTAAALLLIIRALTSWG